MEARVGVVVEGSQKALNSTTHGSSSVVDCSATRKLLQQSHSQLGTVSQLLAGGVAGAVSKTCTAPLARLTILFQVQGMHADVSALNKLSIWHEASRIVNEEGFRAFWKGNLVTVVHRLPYSSVNFYSYEQYKKFLQSIPALNSNGENVKKDVCVHFVAGGLSGLTAASATYPLDLVRTRLAAQRNAMYYRGIWHTLETIRREEGFPGLYKGLRATLLGVGPSIAISFTVYETLRAYWQSKRPNDSTAMVSLTCGSLSGAASSTATFPLDLVRRRMQMEGAGGRACVYTSGILSAFKHIFKTEGLCGLYRGILPEYYKVVPGVGIAFMTYELLKKLLSSNDC
ncbi:Mitochondrial substrate carrier family protein B [Bienertia sinuspersici]